VPSDGPSDVFVDRRTERSALHRWASEAWAGQLRIVTVVGEAGIGKTALVDALVPAWVDEGAVVHSAACQEDLAVPYLPLLTALRGGAGPVMPEAVRSERGAPELFVGVSDQLLDLAGSGRVVLRLDDLHWADPATVDLLGHVLNTAARSALLAPLRLLVVLGYRPLERHPLVDRLVDRLRREPSHRELHLGGIDELGVNQLLGGILGATPSRRLLADVLEITEGNPLFVHNLVHHLEATGALVLDRGEVVSRDEVRAEHIELDDVLRARVESLDGPCQRLVTVAALVGDHSSVDLLHRVVFPGEGGHDPCLDQLETSGLLTELADGTYVFTHPVVRQLLVRGLGPRARRDLHLQIARSLLEVSPEVSDEDALRIAHHLRRAGPKAPPEVVLRYARRASRTSLAVGAWTKAARYAEIALRAAAQTSEPDLQVADVIGLHLSAAMAHFRNHDPGATDQHARAVAELARTTGDLASWGEALLLTHRSRLTLSTDVETDLDAHEDLRRFLDEAGDEVPEVRARCWQLLAEICVSAGEMESAHDAAARARRLAVGLDDDRLLAEVGFAEGLAHFGSLRPAASVRAFDASAAAAVEAGDDWVLAWPLGRLVLAHVMLGDLEAADARAGSALEVSRRTHHWAEEGLARAGDALAALARNDVIRCEVAAEEAIQLHRRSSYPFIASIAWPIQAYARALRLDRLGALDVIGRWRGSGVAGAGRFALLVDALTMTAAELEGAVDLDRYRPAAGSEPHVYRVGGVAVDVELGIRLGERELLVGALERLDGLARGGVRLLLPTGAAVDRLRGMALVGLGDARRGISLLERASAVLGDAGAELERLHCDLERCLALAGIADPAAAAEAPGIAEQLDSASLLGLLERLRTSLPQGVSTGRRLRRTVVVWDMVESTRHLVAVGDEAYVQVVHELNALISRRLSEHRGVAFKYTGDGVFAWFLDSDDAVRCARRVSDDLAQRRLHSPEDPLRLRTGIAVGEPVDDAGDLFGVAVVTAARLCDAAGDGQVLCTRDTVDRLRERVEAVSRGLLDLKGLAAPVEVLQVLAH
jgi:class 3 adenylate cyclase